MTDFLQTSEFVLTMASVYLLIGLGWNLVYKTCGYLNLAIGQFYILGAVFSYKFHESWGVDSTLAAGALSVLVVALIGYAAERLVMRPMQRFGLDEGGRCSSDPHHRLEPCSPSGRVQAQPEYGL